MGSSGNPAPASTREVRRDIGACVGDLDQGGCALLDRIAQQRRPKSHSANDFGQRENVQSPELAAAAAIGGFEEEGVANRREIPGVGAVRISADVGDAAGGGAVCFPEPVATAAVLGCKE